MSGPPTSFKPVTFIATPNLKHPEIWGHAFRLAKLTMVLLGASLVLNVVLAALAVVLAGRPADVVLVDKIGNATFIPEAAGVTQAQDFEAEEFARRWATDFLSLDGVTAKDDLARALSLTQPDLQQRLKAQLIDSGALDRIRNAYVRSTVKFDGVTIGRQADDRFTVELKGARTLTAMGAAAKSVSEPVRLELVLSHVPRTRTTPNGLIVRYLAGSFQGEK